MIFPENYFLNFHAHQQLPADQEIVIQSLFLQEDLMAPVSDKIFFTSGLHPWHADRLPKEQIRKKLSELINSKLILAVGEAGIDRLKGPDIETQLESFKIQIEIAEEFNLPLIIHSVKAHNEVLKLRKEYKPKVPWVIHHFNGSKQMAFDLIDHGFYLSVSHHIRNEHAKLSSYFNELPIKKIFLETDDFRVEIKDLYHIAAEKLDMGLEGLKKQFMLNLKTLINAK